MMLPWNPRSTSLKQSAIIDADRQLVLLTTLFTSTLSPWPTKLTREVSFAQVNSISLDMQEHSRMVPDPVEAERGHSQRLEVNRRWLLGAQLKSGETVILFEQVEDQPAGQIPDASLQRGYWESLARCISEQLERPLLPMAPAPSSSGTFVEVINQMLQRRLEQSPARGRSVRLRSSVFGVEIWVDGRTYRAPDEIEDPDVRAALRAAIDEWQGNVP